MINQRNVTCKYFVIQAHSSVSYDTLPPPKGVARQRDSTVNIWLSGITFLVDSILIDPCDLHVEYFVSNRDVVSIILSNQIWWAFLPVRLVCVVLHIGGLCLSC